MDKFLHVGVFWQLKHVLVLEEIHTREGVDVFALFESMEIYTKAHISHPIRDRKMFSKR